MLEKFLALTNLSAVNPIHLIEKRLRTPEAAHSENDRFQALWEWAVKRSSLDEVLVGGLCNVSSRLFAAGWALIGGKQARDLWLEHKHDCFRLISD